MFEYIFATLVVIAIVLLFKYESALDKAEQENLELKRRYRFYAKAYQKLYTDTYLNNK